MAQILDLMHVLRPNLKRDLDSVEQITNRSCQYTSSQEYWHSHRHPVLHAPRICPMHLMEQLSEVWTHETSET